MSKSSKLSDNFDSCYKFSIGKHYTKLLEIGIDTVSEIGKTKLWSELNLVENLRTNCFSVYQSLTKELDEKNSKILNFTGAFVSETKLENGKYKLILKKIRSGETREFMSDSKHVDENHLKEFIPGEENVIVEYEVIKDAKSNKTYDSIIKVSTIGAVRIK